MPRRIVFGFSPVFIKPRLSLFLRDGDLFIDFESNFAQLLVDFFRIGLQRIRVDPHDHVDRQDSLSPMHQVEWRSSCRFLSASVVRECDKREYFVPVRVIRAHIHRQHVGEGVIDALHLSVRLRVVGSGGTMVCFERCYDFLKHFGQKALPLVGS